MRDERWTAQRDFPTSIQHKSSTKLEKNQFGSSSNVPARVSEQVSDDAAFSLRKYFAAELALLAKTFNSLLLHIRHICNVVTVRTKYHANISALVAYFRLCVKLLTSRSFVPESSVTDKHVKVNHRHTRQNQLVPFVL